MPGGPPPELLPVLRDLFKDRRGEESWPERLDTAALLINDHDASVSRRALDVTLEGLDYAAQPWYGLPIRGSAVRAQAAMVLGTLEPAYRNDDIFVRLTRLLREDDDENVRDSAYKALLLLAVSPEAEHDIESLLDPPPDPCQAARSTPCLIISPLPQSLVIHLSDLHFGTAEKAAIWFSQLAEDLRDLECTRLDAVILSGDIANASTPEEYAAAGIFVEKLLAEFQVSKQNLVMVPGNHDFNWILAKKGYDLRESEDYAGKLEEGYFIKAGDDAVRVRNDARYPKRFEHFAAFYEGACGAPYPLDPTEQAILYPLPAQRLLIVGLNSAWELDHHFKARASINEQALARALDQIRAEPSYKDFLKIAVWHHPVNSPSEDRIKNHGFLERLANADFRLGLHGHIHKAESNLYRYDRSPAGRRLELVCAGTFGAPTRELVPGYPFQYQLLRFEGSTLTVETRRREEIHGAWKPDARWTSERGKDPVPRYQIKL